MACLRMLARFYDLPFRRDVLKRILEDQLRRDSENQGISLLQFAAISDVMGLGRSYSAHPRADAAGAISCFGGG